MGHAGAFTATGEPDARSKVKALESVGVPMVNHPGKFGDVMKILLGELGRGRKDANTSRISQRQSMHTLSRRLRPSISRLSLPKFQSRKLYIREDQAFNLLWKSGIEASGYSGKGKRRLLAVAVDRQKLSPCVIASPTIRVSFPKLITGLVALYMRKEAFLLETKLVESLGGLRVVGARFGFDDAAFRSAKRQMDIHSLR
jgi:succinyl-CoA synthetase alpha subunit